MLFSLDELKLPPFEITIKSKEKIFSMTVAQVYLSAQVERFTVSAGGREFTLQSDRPMLKFSESKKGISWKIIKGGEMVYSNPQAFEEILRKIERHIKETANPM